MGAEQVIEAEGLAKRFGQMRPLCLGGPTATHVWRALT